ncbi:MAG TPA: beta-galactosidase, partial [Lachnospiraceae bacterium]|nr:beta-galactosidase [Lachnospiraceae bacterium]
VYSNQSKVALYMDGVKIDEQEGERVFRFICTINGTHKVVAKSQDASDEIEIKYVAEPDETYIFNKAASNVSNWFDSEQIDKDCFSINDKLEDLQAHPKAGQVVKSMMDKASEARGDVAQSVKDNPQLQRMMGKMTLISLLKQAGSDEESIKQLNRILQGIKKQL